MRQILPALLVVFFLSTLSNLSKAQDIDAPPVATGDTLSEIGGTTAGNQPLKTGTGRNDSGINRNPESNSPLKTDKEKTSELVPRLMGLMEAGIDWVLWLLFGLGTLCIFILIERTIYFLLYARGAGGARDKLCGYLGSGDLKSAHTYFKGRREIVSRVLAEAISNHRCAPEAIAETVEARLMLERQRLERGLIVVGTIGSNAPFIGLFGTVLGIIKAFHDLSVADQAGPSVVMAGISEALVATAVGLLIAIPAVVIFNVFKARSRSTIMGAESVFKLYLGHQLNVCLSGDANKDSCRPPGEDNCRVKDSSHEK